MDQGSRLINRFLVENFNNILLWEEKVLSAYSTGRLSVNEFHILEAVILCREEGHNTMGDVARRLGVTLGTLTTAVKTLERKGYLCRDRGGRDRRVVWLHPTQAALEANGYHAAFHQRMVSAILDCLDRHQLAALTEALEVLSGYFRDLEREADYVLVEEPLSAGE